MKKNNGDALLLVLAGCLLATLAISTVVHWNNVMTNLSVGPVVHTNHVAEVQYEAE